MFILTIVDAPDHVSTFTARSVSGLVCMVVEAYCAWNVAQGDVLHSDAVWPAVYWSDPDWWDDDLEHLNEGLEIGDDSYIHVPERVEITAESVCMVARRLLKVQCMVSKFENGHFRVYPVA